MTRYRDFADWLVQKLGDRKQADVARVVGVSRQAVTTWVNGTAAPEGENLTRLASYLGEETSTIERLIGRAPRESRSPEITFEDAMRLLNLKAPFPLRVEGIASAGPGSPQDIIWRDARDRGRNLRTVTVTGHCMSPRIEPGDAVTIDLDGSPRPGRIVAAQKDGELVVKRYQGEFLEADDGTSVPTDGYQIIGTVIDVTKRLE